MTERQSPQKSAPNIAKQLISRITKFEKIRFVLVGGLNTSVDFIILIVLVSLLGFPSFIANIISTSIALVVSYALNKKAVFGNTDPNNHRQFILFITVTLFGLWVLQTIIITLVSPVIANLINTSHTNAIVLVIAKLLATIVSLTWNYLWYSRVIFSQKKPTKQ